MNYDLQQYKGIPLRLVERNYEGMNAKRYVINDTNQNVWIPNKHLNDDGTMKPGENIDYVFRKAQRQLVLAGITQAIPGIKRRTEKPVEEENFRVMPVGFTNGLYTCGELHGVHSIYAIVEGLSEDSLLVRKYTKFGNVKYKPNELTMEQFRQYYVPATEEALEIFTQKACRQALNDLKTATSVQSIETEHEEEITR